MEKTPFVLALFLAVIALVATNQGIRKHTPRNSGEISSYEYAKLQAAMEHDEIATVARRELTQDYVSISEYNKIMTELDRIKRKQTRQMAAM